VSTLSPRARLLVAIGIVAAIVAFSFVQLPGVSIPAFGWAEGMPLRARSLSPLRVGATPFLGSSVVVFVATLILRRWAAWSLERKVRVAGWLGMFLAAASAWSQGTTLVALGGEAGFVADAGFAATVRITLSLLAGSAALWAAARWIDASGVGSGLVWVLAAESIADGLSIDGGMVPRWHVGVYVASWVGSAALLAWVLNRARSVPTRRRAPVLVLPEPGLGFVVAWAVVAAAARVVGLLFSEPNTLLRLVPSWPRSSLSTPWGLVPDHPSYWIALSVLAALGAAFATLAVLGSSRTRAAWQPLLGSSTAAALVETRGPTSLRAALLGGAIVAVVLAASSLELALASPFVVVFALEAVATARAPARVSIPSASEPYAAEAELEALRSSGIDATLGNDAALRLVPALGPLFTPALRVPPAAEEDALRALEALRATGSSETSESAAVLPATTPAPASSSWTKPALAGVLWVAASSFPWVEAAFAPPVPDAAPVVLTVHRVDDEVELVDDLNWNGPGKVSRENAPLGAGKTEVRSFVTLIGLEGEDLRRAEAEVTAALSPYVLAWEDSVDMDGRATTRPYVLFDEVELDGANVVAAECELDASGYSQQWFVTVSLDVDGAERFASATRRWTKRRLAIVVDGRVLSAPVIMSEIPGGQLSITMGRSLLRDEARAAACALAAGLRAGSARARR
jgi:hypothetical protein